MQPSGRVAEGHHAVYHGLDGMRGLAALLIVPRHLPALFGTGVPPGSYLGVDLFFLLSGFVIANAYGPRLAQGMTFAQFARIRVVRLYPLYLLGLLLGTASVLASHALPRDTVWWHLALSTLSVPNPSKWGNLFPLDSPSWSLMLEILVNVFYALTSTLVVGRALVAVIVASLLGILGFVWAHGMGGIDAGWSKYMIPFGVLRVAFSFHLGIFLHRSGAHLRLAGSPRTRSNLACWALLACLCLVLTSPVGSGLRVPCDLLAITVAFPALVVTGASLRPSGVTLRGLATLGAASYAIYVLHEPVGTLSATLLGWGGHAPQPDAPLFGIVLTILLVPTCVALDAFYDRPIRRMLSSRLRPRRQPVVAA